MHIDEKNIKHSNRITMYAKSAPHLRVPLYGIAHDAPPPPSHVSVLSIPLHLNLMFQYVPMQHPASTVHTPHY